VIRLPLAALIFCIVQGYAVERHDPFPAEQVKISGPLAARLDLSEHYLAARSDQIAANMGWGADQYARWIEAMVLLEQASGRRGPELPAILGKFLSLQAADGSFLMSPAMRRQEWWGAARAMVALMHCQALRPDPGVLSAWRRHGEFLLAQAPLPASTDTLIHAHYHSALEGMVALSGVTGDARYRGWAERVAAILDPEVAPPGPKQLAHQPITSLVRGWAPHQHHTHSYLEAVQGVVDLYRATGGGAHLAFARKVWEDTVRHTMWVSGGIPEVYGEYFEHNDETCPVTSWILLGLKLYRETGEARYLDVVERSTWNHLMFNQDARGGFYADRSLCLRERVQPDNRGSVADACCSMHGARGLHEVQRYIFTRGAHGLDVNFFFPASVAWTPPGSVAPLLLRLDTEYPTAGNVRLTVIEGRAKAALRMRLPGFARKVQLRVNGRPADYSSRAGFAVLERTWQPGDRLDYQFDLPVSIVPRGRTGFEPASRVEETVFEEAALLKGPLVLMLERETNALPEGGSDWTVVVYRRPDGRLYLPSAPPPAGLKLSPPVRFTSRLARGGEAPGKGRPVVFVPMAEMTAHATPWPDAYRVRNRVVVLSAKQ
jgi:hypothetical protein